MTPTHGSIEYLQLPALDVGRSAAFYEAVFGWEVEGHGGFTAPGMIGQWTTDRPPSPASGPLLWICADRLSPTLDRVAGHGGTVHGRPQLDGGERWLVEVDDPAGNRIGVVVPVRRPQSQTMIAVHDVEASSRWYQELLGLRSDHGGSEYERLLAGDVLVLQLHHRDVEHHHGRIADTDHGNGVLLWFGEVAEFDDVVARAEKMQASISRPVHRNPPEGGATVPGTARSGSSTRTATPSSSPAPTARPTSPPDCRERSRPRPNGTRQRHRSAERAANSRPYDVIG